jgi:monooxygenase
MDAHDLAVCTPTAPSEDLSTEPMLDLKAGYVLRSIDMLPKQGATAPWRVHQNYIKDLRLLKRGPLDDAVRFSPRARTFPPAPVQANGQAKGGQAAGGRHLRDSREPGLARV